MAKISSYEPHDFLATSIVSDRTKIQEIKKRLKKEIDADIGDYTIDRFLIPLQYDEIELKDGSIKFGWFAKAMVKFAEVDTADIPKGILQGLGLR